MNDLLTFHQGDAGRVQHIDAGRRATHRLHELGFCKGALVKMVRNDGGPVIVSLSDNKVALGRGLAEKIILGPVNGCAEPHVGPNR